jgi:hypothetical protein
MPATKGSNRWAAIDMLSDDVLLEIFKIHLEEQTHFFSSRIPIGDDLWFTLVHVCHRWQCLVFASPRSLGLKLLCTSTRPVKKMVDAWPPALPIIIRDKGSFAMAGFGRKHHRRARPARSSV